MMARGLPVSLRLAMCLAKRERDPSGCRASGLTLKLPVHVVLVPPPSLGVVVIRNLSTGFYSCRPPHCPAESEAYRRGRLSDGHI